MEDHGGIEHPTSEKAVTMRRIRLVTGLAAVLCLSIACFAQAYPVTVVDDRIQEITIDQLPKRIVTVGSLYTQIVIDLGALDRLVAVGESPDNPDEVIGLPTVGLSSAPSVEVILGFEPDLVLGATDYGGERPALEAAGVTVLTTPWLTSVASIFETIRTLATALGVSDEGERLIGEIAMAIVELEGTVLGKAPVSAAFLYASSPDNPPYAAGSDAIEHELILRAGGTNIFGDLVWTPPVSFEEIIARDPEVIFTAPSQIENISGNPFLQSVSAVVHGRVFGIRASLVASTRVAEALRAIIAGLHGIEP